MTDSEDRHVNRARAEAERLTADPSLADRVAKRASVRAERFRSRLGDALDDVRALSRLVRAWAEGRYRQIPVASIAAALVALVYFLMPLDALPDFLVAIGLVDDMAVIARVVHHLRGDLRRFRAWEEQQDNITGKADGQ